MVFFDDNCKENTDLLLKKNSNFEIGTIIITNIIIRNKIRSDEKIGKVFKRITFTE